MPFLLPTPWEIDLSILPRRYEGRVVLAGAESFPVVFAAPLATAVFKIKLETSLDTATGGAVEARYDARTVTPWGFTIIFTAPFNGVLTWEAEHAAP